jgi:hypothetical protein
MRGILDEKQYVAFEEFSRKGMEWEWKNDVSLLTDNLSEELDLRFSEAERVRQVLESNYPKANILVPCLHECPPDPLVDNPKVKGAVRNSLDATHHVAFESYLGKVRAARERARRIVNGSRLYR